MTDIPPWNDAATPPPYKEKGGFLKTIIGILHINTPVSEVREIAGMPGVETEIVEKDGKKGILVSLNEMIKPK